MGRLHLITIGAAAHVPTAKIENTNTHILTMIASLYRGSN
jgi:hypothetical protein